MKRLAAVLFWSAISAAFIGPGTVTACARAGADHGLALAWALVFSTAACWALQEAAARVTIASGRPLGATLGLRVTEGRRKAAGRVAWSVVGAVVLGCAAYEAGNVLGAAAGAELVTGLPVRALALFCGALAATGLIAGSPRALAYALGLVVAVMGLAFVVCAIAAGPRPAALVSALVRPGVPAGAEALVLGLIGTTVVPYNLFLGSGLARGRDLGETRVALGAAIVIGGAISLAILVVGTAVSGPFAFESVAGALADRIGAGGAWLFGAGLFAAGLSSAMTAPLAAGLAVASLLPGAESAHGRTTRVVAGGVLLFGLAFGLSGVRPIPVIIAAQALNGLLLPFVAVTLLVAANDRSLVGERGMSGLLANVTTGAAVAVTFVLGARSILGAAWAAAGAGAPGATWPLAGGVALALVAAVPVLTAIRRARVSG